jgi:hypothetical protein
MNRRYLCARLNLIETVGPFANVQAETQRSAQVPTTRWLWWSEPNRITASRRGAASALLTKAQPHLDA